VLTLYYSPGACSLATHILLEEAGASFEPALVAIAERAHHAPAFLALNPRGRVPALGVEEAVVTEAVAIMTYIAKAFPDARLIPEDALLASQVYEKLLFFSASVHIAFAQLWRMERFSDDPSTHSAIKESGRRLLSGYFAEIDAMFGGNEWLVAHRFTAADTYPLVFHRWARRIGEDVDRYPSWQAHTQRMLNRPAVLRAITREGLTPVEF
jgi:glutathione S-transferase